MRTFSLHICCRAGLHDIIPSLVEKGAKVGARDGKSVKTALHYVTMTGEGRSSRGRVSANLHLKFLSLFISSKKHKGN